MENLGKIIKEIDSVESLDGQRNALSDALDRVYGAQVRRPVHLHLALISEDTGFAAGLATHEELTLIADYGAWECEIPFTAVIPKGDGPFPAFVHISDVGGSPNKHQPTEELVELGFAVFTLKATDDITDALPSERGCGRLSRYAHAASIVIDYAESLCNIDKSKIAVIGHEHLGTAALLCACRDGRVGYAVCNGSGVHTNRRNIMRELLPALFSDAERAPEGADSALLALIAPRPILFGCSEADLYASASEIFSLVRSVSGIYALYGMSVPEEISCEVNTDCVHFHIRSGECYLSRKDWRMYAEYVLKTLATSLRVL